MHLRTRTSPFLFLPLFVLAGCPEPPTPKLTGEVGGPCFPNATCTDGARCEDSVCAACELGTEGCGCDDGDTCGPSLTCASGLCFRSGLIPETPKCYSACRTGFVDDTGSYRACGPDGLMEGCLGDATCVDGSCLAGGNNAGFSNHDVERTYPFCQTDLDCPVYQLCLEGQCYSNCETDGDCAEPDTVCHMYACRPTCNATGELACPTNTYCSIGPDGQSGVCLPAAPVDAVQAVPAPGGFTVFPPSLSFDDTSTSAVFTLTNTTQAPATFVIQKARHTEFTNDGPVLIRENALQWLHMGESETSLVPELTVELAPGESKTIRLANARNSLLSHWTGSLKVVSQDGLGVQDVTLSFTGGVEGEWSGNMMYYAYFPATRLPEWAADPDDNGKLLAVKNALIQRWGAFKAGSLSVNEFKAVLTSTETESWKWALLREYCPDENVACYPYDNPQGYSVYSPSIIDQPIPSGVTELPLTMYLRSADGSTDGSELSGRIVTNEALHYTGDPAVAMSLSTSPTSCPTTADGSTVCDIQSFAASVLVGGRYVPSGAGAPCADAPEDANGDPSFALDRTPWLVPGFKRDGLNVETVVDPTSGFRYRHECRDQLLPFGAGLEEKNASFAGSNPIPDGKPRVRTLTLLDGVIVNQREMIVLFEETFESFLGDDDSSGFSAYGIMVLRRLRADLDDEEYEGFVPSDDRDFTENRLSVGCSEDLIQKALGPSASGFPTDAAELRLLAERVVTGRSAGATTYEIPAGDSESIHYFCEDIGLIDGGRFDRNAAQAETGEVECPVGSNVQYFTLQGVTQTDIAGLGCQSGYATETVVEQLANGTTRTLERVKTRGTCLAQIQEWRASQTYDIRMEPVWRCTDENRAYCDDNRRNLREGKTFYRAPPANEPRLFVGLEPSIESAFRYKTRFKNRTGQSVGFAPQICAPGSDAIPYCYDPGVIEEIRERVDCAVEIYTDHKDALESSQRTLLRDYLRYNFAYVSDGVDPVTGFPITREGFERLHAELLIMLGDESFTRAFASRFDLAGQNLVSFEGSLFEPDGINLSGGAGFEMYSLYQAIQYYQMVLDRFYALSPHIWRSMQSTVPGQPPSEVDQYITQATVTAFFDRLIRASTQKARAWSEIAKRYQNFNEPELARSVVQRAYTSAYLESVVLSRMMLRLRGVVLPEDLPVIVQRVEQAQLSYRSALLEMRDVFEDITDDLTLFGFPPAYIPFPALDNDDTNAFKKQFGIAQTRMANASEKERIALESNRSFETDAAAFQSELASIRNNYENQLAALCGTFPGEDGNIYVAIPKYAQYHEKTRLVGNPCGLVGNGEIFEATIAVGQAGLDMKEVATEYDLLFQAIDIERDRVNEYCGQVVEHANYVYEQLGEIHDLNEHIRGAQILKETTERLADQAATVISIGLSSDSFPGVVTALSAAAAQTAIFAVADTIILGSDIGIAVREKQIDDLEQEQAQWELLQECDYARVDSNARVKELLLDLLRLDIQALRAQENMKLALSQLQHAKNEATRTMGEQQETSSLAINVEAARNDPNVRIYKNDAILTADQTFRSAVREAYKATKVYEYYTSQSYARLGDLFLIRMVEHGDLTLERYLAQLEDAFLEFEEAFGNPDQRVKVISLRRDIFQIEDMLPNGEPLTEAEASARFRERLLDVTKLDERGYYAFDFATRLDQLSPLTRNHKIRAVEVNILGEDVGDPVARVYLRQKGTGVVRGVDGEKIFYGFDPRTAVINAFFEEKDYYLNEARLYTNERLRDRPFVNTSWQLIVNRRDEADNLDINFQSLSDIQLYIFYSDFTEL